MSKFLLGFAILAAVVAFVMPVRSLADEGSVSVLCGASINGGPLKMTYNPLSGLYATDIDEPRVMFFLDVSRQDRVVLAMVETLPNLPKRWTQIWMGYMKDIVHMEFTQADYALSVSCQKVSGSKTGPSL